MPPLMNTPAHGGEVHGLRNIFTWLNGHGSMAPPHHARNAYQWRVKVGSSQYGSNYYSGYPVAKTPLEDPNVNFTNNPPPNGSTCWALVEWTLSPGGTWYAGSPTSFTYHTS